MTTLVRLHRPSRTADQPSSFPVIGVMYFNFQQAELAGLNFQSYITHVPRCRHSTPFLLPCLSHSGAPPPSLNCDIGSSTSASMSTRLSTLAL
ncbi:hypothetical protein PVAP13_8KG275901 [Panicum virgatum]|uniref:Uncharacterized protein n=1 Tax=Panicum virgatum TaxID=38727 RepID=A0A8T0PII4_PANVG|nr:hypothetical protein PVAP13_8KG275901 [Panicum virgatum]